MITPTKFEIGDIVRSIKSGLVQRVVSWEVYLETHEEIPVTALRDEFAYPFIYYTYGQYTVDWNTNKNSEHVLVKRYMQSRSIIDNLCSMLGIVE